ncbi:hypothetical protein Ddc_09827 [Ditylenchus destructor]|nr:hypothetical protein Ddc_09827 [Ditylenchus destructor]
MNFVVQLLFGLVLINNLSIVIGSLDGEVARLLKIQMLKEKASEAMHKSEKAIADGKRDEKLLTDASIARAKVPREIVREFLVSYEEESN